MDICNRHFKVLLKARYISHVFTKLYGHQIKFITQKDIKKVECTTAILHTLPRSEVDAIGNGVTVLVSKLLCTRSK